MARKAAPGAKHRPQSAMHLWRVAWGAGTRQAGGGAEVPRRGAPRPSPPGLLLVLGCSTPRPQKIKKILVEREVVACTEF